MWTAIRGKTRVMHAPTLLLTLLVPHVVLLERREEAGAARNSMRSTPPQQVLESDSKVVNADVDAGQLPDVKLAMTPENIRPLLENAREVLERLRSYNGEIRLLLAS
jgi:hypothetical protein